MNHHIEIYVDRKRLGQHIWGSVPRTGDFLRLGPPDSEVTVQVMRVYWVVLDSTQVIQLVCESR